jgi:hypothetical protein
MKVRVRHPVPVRWPAQRSPRDHVDYMAAETTVEIPETGPGSFSEPVPTSEVLQCRHRVARHRGGHWLRVAGRHLAGGEDDVAAPLAGILSFLAGRTHAKPDGLARAGTPLAGTEYPLFGHPAPHGRDLPDPVIRRIRTDNTDAARAALAAYVADNLATDGAALHMRVCPPVVTPANLPKPSLILPWYVTMGPSFAPHRIDEIEAFAVGASLRGRNGIDAIRQSIDGMQVFPDEAYGGMDLAQFVNGAPALLERAADRVMRRRDLAVLPYPESLQAAMEAMRAYGDLGLVGAIPREAFADAVDLTLRAASAIRGLCPEGYFGYREAWGDIPAFRLIVAAACPG